MNDPLEESKVAESANAAAVAKEAEHNAIKEMVTTIIEEQTSKIYKRMDAFEIYSKNRFEEGDRRMDLLATKQDLQDFRALFIDPLTGKSYVEQLTMVVQNFTIAAKVISSSSRWLYRALIAIAVIVGAVSLITGGIKMAGVTLVHWFLPSPS